jgi:hypothetical protein
MPTEAMDGYRYPPFGTSHLYMNIQSLGREDKDFMDCMYFTQWDLGHVCFHEGWSNFTAAANIRSGALLLIKVEPMQEYIGLSFVEIIN